MATAKKEQPAKMTIAETRAENERLKLENSKLKDGAYCYMCDTHKTKDSFYKRTDPRLKSGITPICKKCSYDLAMRKDKNGEYVVYEGAIVEARIVCTTRAGIIVEIFGLP